MSKNVHLSSEDIIHLGKLANLQLSEAEIQRFQNQLTETLQYVENLQELDVSQVAPTNHSTDQENVMFEDGTPCERMFSQQQATANAKDKKNNYFIVKRIL